jgi:hypothetical protein
MSKRDYNEFAKIFGKAFARTRDQHEDELVYDTMLEVEAYFKQHNPHFSELRFSEAVSSYCEEVQRTHIGLPSRNDEPIHTVTAC